MTNMSPEEIEREMANPDAWGEPTAPRKKSEKRQRGAMISVRLTREELATVQALAQRHNQTLGAFIRDRALQVAVGATSSAFPTSLSHAPSNQATPHRRPIPNVEMKAATAYVAAQPSQHYAKSA